MQVEQNTSCHRHGSINVRRKDHTLVQAYFIPVMLNMSASNVVYKYSRSLRIMATHTSSMHKLMNATATSRMYQQSGNKYTCALLSNKNTISYYCLCTLIQNDIMYVSVCIYTSCPNLLRMRSVPNENKMRHNLPFRDEITIEIQNRSPLA